MEGNLLLKIQIRKPGDIIFDSEPAVVDEIVCLQIFEQLTMAQLRGALVHWWYALKPGGSLHVSVSDMALINNEMTESQIAAITVNKKLWLSAENLVDMLLEFGFSGMTARRDQFITEIKCQKVDLYAAERYAWEYPIKNGESVLEVGPGNFPFERADRYLDISDDFQRDLHGKPLDIGNVEKMLYQDNEYDVVIACHIVEHTDNPDIAIEELQRVGKRGVIEVPSTHKDWIMQHGHVHTKWQVTAVGNTLVFVAIAPEKLQYLSDVMFRNNIARVTQYPPDKDYMSHMLRRMFWKSNSFLNPTVFWDASKQVKCVIVRG